MNKYSTQWIQDWCHENGWTDLFVERREYWAFPPHAVMPMPIPSQVLHAIKAEKGFSPHEKVWYGSAFAVTTMGILSSCLLACPMPLVAAFAFCAVTVAQTEDE